MDRQAPPPPPGSGLQRPKAGWYADPAQPTRWRWWDGHDWTDYVGEARRKPRLPAWLSVPVLIGAILVLPGVVFAVVRAPLPALLPLPTFLIVLAVFVWFDRLEPEPWPERIHAVLWGATIAILVSGVLNSLVMVVFGEVAGILVSAPIVEELMKGLGVLYAVRRRKVDSVIDGVVYAGWVAAGFAAVENVQYFLSAAGMGELGAVFVMRGVLSPFAHPLFTIWIGAGIGAAVARGKNPVIGAIPGYLAAVLLHALWNGTAVLGRAGAAGSSLLLLGAFVLLFVLTAVRLLVIRLRGRNTTARMIPHLAARYGLTEREVASFSDWRRTLATRRQLSRQQRREFDARHAAIARLAALNQRSGEPDPDVERRMVERLWEARKGA